MERRESSERAGPDPFTPVKRLADYAELNPRRHNLLTDNGFLAFSGFYWR
jgi:hypothetical protein